MMMTKEPKVNFYKLSLARISLVFTHAIILFLVSLLFVALVDPFDPYSPFKFLIIIVQLQLA